MDAGYVAGVFGLIGNVLVARRIDTLGADRGVQLTLISVLAGVALLPAGKGLTVVAALALAVWGLGLFGSNSSQQVRLAGIAPPLASASIALNTSSIYLGQAIGPVVYGIGFAHGGPEPTIFFGAVVVLGVGFVCSQMLRRRI